MSAHWRGFAACLTSDQFRQLKPLFVVRRPEHFESAFYRWTGAFFVAFLLVHVWWSVRGFGGDPWLLPATMLLAGAGLILMIALRDPVRDTLLFVDFAQGVAGGCLLLAAASGLDYERLLGKLSFVPLLASFALSAMLMLFGSGPGTSDAKVNLLGFQPVEIIRLLLVLFLAGYFAQRWDVLRHARETRPRLAGLTKYLDIPPLEYILPVAVSVALSLMFFFLQRDMGPALVFACLFLVLYGMARSSALAPVAGLALVVAGFAVGYWLGVPHTVGERVRMWLSPWDNLVHGGDQLAHSLWAYATGGPAGMGTGQGDPQAVPAAHTDLILAALGEEWGFIGVAAAFAALRRVGVADAARGGEGAYGLRMLSGGGTGGDDGAADSADCRRLAGSGAAFRSGDAVPELRAHRHAGELRGGGDGGGDFSQRAGRAKAGSEAGAVGGRHLRDRRGRGGG